MANSIQLEGKWEEILTHAAYLAGRRVRVTVLQDSANCPDDIISPASGIPLTLAERQAILQLPLEERQRVLAERSAVMIDHYNQDPEWQEFLAGDVLEY